MGRMVPSEGIGICYGWCTRCREGAGRRGRTCEARSHMVVRHQDVCRWEGEWTRKLWLPGHGCCDAEPTDRSLHPTSVPCGSAGGLSDQVDAWAQHQVALEL